MSDSAVVADAFAEGVRRWRRRRRWTAVLVVVLVLALGAGVAGTVWLVAEARERALAARTVTTAQQEAVAAAFAATAETATQLTAQREAYRAAVAVWESAVRTDEEFKAGAEPAAPSAPNPGGGQIPGGDADARALLDGLGGTDVQIVYDGGPQNCGYASADDAYQIALGGCYDNRFRTTVFLAWDPGAARSDIWAIFVHEAMHWYQWDRYATLFAAADQVGVDQGSYRSQIESDASCRAVIQHGVPRAFFDRSTAPCDVEGWHDGWLVEQLAGLGVPTAAPDPEAYEVQEVTRP